MIEIIDLSKTKSLPVKFSNGTEIRLVLPDKALYDKMTAIDAKIKANKDDAEQVFKLLKELCISILKNDMSKGTALTRELIEELSFGNMMTIVRGYTEFVRGELNDPN